MRTTVLEWSPLIGVANCVSARNGSARTTDVFVIQHDQATTWFKASVYGLKKRLLFIEFQMRVPMCRKNTIHKFVDVWLVCIKQLSGAKTFNGFMLDDL